MFELPIQQLIFLFIAAVAIFAAFNVILQRNPIYSALSLIIVMCALAGSFLLLNAQFVAAMQVIVYAGAVMVLFVFVIMLLNVRTEEARQDRLKYLKLVTPLLFIALLAEVFFVARSVTTTAPPLVTRPGEHPYGTVEAVGEAMFSTYLFPFEATSVLILMAMVGSLILARKRTAKEAETLGRMIEEANQPPLAPTPTPAELEEKQHELAA
ncbi:MAG TPA: NADH-quinone oxidoreductase subunit J [Blastocatellia bacterium]|nr:NADH-quinone oxidoreductase subunit J [Blastocatellia bacterium]